MALKTADLTGFENDVLPPLAQIVDLSLDRLGLASAKFVMGTYAATASRSGARPDANSSVAMHADIARQQSGMTGAGVKIGILSDSFDLKDGAASDVTAGDLPPGIVVQEEGGSGSDEGRAMAELIHQVAPGAQLYFHTATNGEADFAAGIASLQAAGCTVIVDDVAYLDEPFFQTGAAVQSAVGRAVGHGTSYFTAASNEGSNFIQEGFSGHAAALPGLIGRWQTAQFGGLSFTTLTIPQHGVAYLDLQWDQPYASIGGGQGSSDSVGLALYTDAGELVGVAAHYDVGQDPRQVMNFTNTLNTTSFRLVVFANGTAPPPEMFKLIVYGNATLTDPAAGTGSGSVIGHELSPDANTIGAVNYASTPAFGGAGTPERFSSVGTGQILFDAEGHRLATPISADKVSFLAPDGDLTSVLAPFFGTSAAAPNAAAVAALVMQADPYLTPTQVSGILAQTCAPVSGGMGAVGSGLIQADAAVALAQSMVGHGL